jgi:soluble lytic murein transglycosylase-like protein
MFPATELIELARQTAIRHRLAPELVCAVVEQESSWNPCAIRYEPEFRDRYVTALGLPPTEEISRSTSWGLMQVMGQVAREYGFKAKFLAELCVPVEGLDVGCTVLAAKLSAAGGDAAQSLLLWNGGGDRSYADRVLNRMASYSASP